jgi:hypothetical protein
MKSIFSNPSSQNSTSYTPVFEMPCRSIFTQNCSYILQTMQHNFITFSGSVRKTLKFNVIDFFYSLTCFGLEISFDVVVGIRKNIKFTGLNHLYSREHRIIVLAHPCVCVYEF